MTQSTTQNATRRSFDYAAFLDASLPAAGCRRDPDERPTVVDLFAGTGGLSLGFESAGFRTVGFEKLPDACETYRRNLRADCRQVVLDERTDFAAFDAGSPVALIGGVPCQPFSTGGNQKGAGDARNGFPAFLAAAAALRPPLVLFENVPGLLGRSRPYFDSVVAALVALGYTVEHRVLDAADFGVPQRRRRLVVVGHHGDWRFPEPVGDALHGAAYEPGEVPRYLTASMDAYVGKYEKASGCVNPRDLRLDAPSRTVTCRNLKGATGDMLRLREPDGRRRRLSVREAARLQGFPDRYVFAGSEGSRFEQIGNAVPPLLALAVARRVADYLRDASLA